MSTESAFSFSSATKRYRDFLLRQRIVALRDFSLKTKPGEMVGLLGPNGSGKSTVLKLACGLISPTEGKVQLQGKDPRNASARHGLGYLPEENANYPFLTARQAVLLQLRLSGVRSRDANKRADGLLDRVGMLAARNRRCGGFSKGMSRRVGLAQCLAADPKLLILDEPTSGLDPIAMEMVRDLITSLKSDGVSMLVSSHLMAEIDDLCDRVVVLAEGKELRSGTLNELLGQKNIWQASFESSKPAAELEQALQSADASKIKIKPAMRTLADFYRDVVQGEKKT